LTVLTALLVRRVAHLMPIVVHPVAMLVVWHVMHAVLGSTKTKVDKLPNIVANHVVLDNTTTNKDNQVVKHVPVDNFKIKVDTPLAKIARRRRTALLVRRVAHLMSIVVLLKPMPVAQHRVNHVPLILTALLALFPHYIVVRQITFIQPLVVQDVHGGDNVIYLTTLTHVVWSSILMVEERHIPGNATP